MRRIVIAANWKMNKTIDEGLSFVNGLKEKYPKTHPVEVIVCAPYTMLFSLAEKIIGTGISLGAENLFWEEKGAYTGEISARMVVDTGCDYVIVGHSERRQYFHETDEHVNKKIKAALDEKLKVIFCLGETLQEREAGQTAQKVSSQLKNGLKDIEQSQLVNIVVAYEPIWAIGTGETATPQQAGEIHSLLRKIISDNYSRTAGEQIRILYGGSVKPANVDELLAIEDIDGALVGGASLDLTSFLRLVNFKS